MSPAHWDTAKDNQLRTLFADGASDIVMAGALEKTPLACRRRRQVLGLLRERSGGPPPRIITPRERQENFNRLGTVITRIETTVPAGKVLGNVVRLHDRVLTVIDYSPDADLVCVDVKTKEVIVVAWRRGVQV